MLFTKTIRQLIALVMLVVFAFSITPQQVVHDMVAKHLDPTVCDVHKDVPVDQVENAKLHCTFDFQVATTPFVDYHFDITFASPVVAKTRNTIFIAAPISYLVLASDSRGPPAC